MISTTAKIEELISKSTKGVPNFTQNATLNPKFWKNMRINSIFASSLMKIAQDVVDNSDFEKFLVDIIVTGSTASYNWHSLSDIDLHIVLDFSKIDKNKDLVSDFLSQKRMNWNNKHNIFLAGHEVEIYFQDVDEDHEAAGVYSLVQSKWLQKPIKNSQKFDICAIKCKAETIARDIDMAHYLYEQEDFQKAREAASKIREKVKKLRNSGLSSSGVFSVENMAFKLLRNSGFLEKLRFISTKSYDSMFSRQKFPDLQIKINKPEI